MTCGRKGVADGSRASRHQRYNVPIYMMAGIRHWSGAPALTPAVNSAMDSRYAESRIREPNFLNTCGGQIACPT